MTLALVETHVEDALALIVPQYSGDVVVHALAGATAGHLQEIERATWALYSLTLDDADGQVLDDLYGALLAESRGNAPSDAVYRQRLRARALVLRSSGTREQLLAILDAIDGVANEVKIVQAPPAGMVIFHLSPAVDEDAEETFVRFLREARKGGVRLAFVFSFAPLAGTLVLGDCAVRTLDGMLPSGEDVVPLVEGVAGLPAAGRAIIDPHDPLAEEISYTLDGGDVLLMISTTQAHDDGVDVYFLPTDEPGQALGDVDDPLVGGVLASVRIA